MTLKKLLENKGEDKLLKTLYVNNKPLYNKMEDMAYTLDVDIKDILRYICTHSNEHIEETINKVKYMFESKHYKSLSRKQKDVINKTLTKLILKDLKS